MFDCSDVCETAINDWPAGCWFIGGRMVCELENPWLTL